MIPLLEPSRAIILSDGTMSDIFRRWTFDVSQLTLLTGMGSPEGYFSASQGQEYMDTSGVAGSIKYIKRDADIGGDKTKGWILI